MIETILIISILSGVFLTIVIYGAIIWLGLRKDQRNSKKKRLVPVIILALLSGSCSTTDNIRTGYLVSISGKKTNVHRLTTTAQTDSLVTRHLGFCISGFSTSSLMPVSGHIQITLDGKDIYLQQIQLTGRKRNGKFRVRKLTKKEREQLKQQ